MVSAHVRSFALCAAVAALVAGCENNTPVPVTAAPERTEGTAVYLLIDRSGSMNEQVPNAQGAREQKLAIAKRAAIAVCESVAKFAAEDPKRTLRLGVASFSDETRVIVPLESPNLERAKTAINALSANGGTAIGDATQMAQTSLDATRLKSQHILILTDGDNTAGTRPEAVAAGINTLPELLRPTVYVVAFDINASVFSKVKSQGWQIFPAANGTELSARLDEVVGGRILIER